MFHDGIKYEAYEFNHVEETSFHSSLKAFLLCDEFEVTSVDSQVNNSEGTSLTANENLI